MRQNKDKKFREIEKRYKNTSFKAKKGKKINTNMIGWWIKGSQHLKTLFIAIEAKTLLKCG